MAICACGTVNHGRLRSLPIENFSEPPVPVDPVESGIPDLDVPLGSQVWRIFSHIGRGTRYALEYYHDQHRLLLVY